jgi:predicted PhzF superfamily epimerase YddE/YHI9
MALLMRMVSVCRAARGTPQTNGGRSMAEGQGGNEGPATGTDAAAAADAIVLGRKKDAARG